MKGPRKKPGGIAVEDNQLLAFVVVFQLNPLLDFHPEELCLCWEIFVFSCVNFSVLFSSLDRRAEANDWCLEQRFLCLICAF